MLNAGICNESVRVGGFGPVSNMHLTSCFLDTVFVLIPTWIFLFGLFPLALVSRHPHAFKRPARRVVNSLLILYYVLVGATIAMEVLEIARLAISHSGIGLLPFQLAGLLAALLLLVLRHRAVRPPGRIGSVVLFYWVFLTIVSAVKLSTLVWEEQHRGKGPSSYLYSDQLLDNAVIVGLYAVFAVGEVVIMVTRPWRPVSSFSKA